MKEQIIFLSSQFPPDKSGIAGYTGALFSGLQERNHSVMVATHKEWASSPAINSKQILPIFENYNLDELNKIPLDRQNQCSRIVVFLDSIKFAPFANPDMIQWIIEKKQKGHTFDLVIHRLGEHLNPMRQPINFLKHHRKQRALTHLIHLADRIFVSTTNWVKRLLKYEKESAKKTIWLPVPAHFSKVDDINRLNNLKKAFFPANSFIIGTFGNFNDQSFSTNLEKIIPPILKLSTDLAWLAIGRGGDKLIDRIKKKHKDLTNQLATSDEIDKGALSANIQICSLMIQPYLFGIDASRTSAIINLAHGLPMITTLGSLTEDIWLRSKCVDLIGTKNIDLFTERSYQLISSSHQRAKLSQKALSTYENLFSIDHSIDTFLAQN